MTDKNPTPLPTENNYYDLMVRGGIAPQSEGEYYKIRIKGHLERHWLEWLGELHISHEEQRNSN